MTRTLKVHETQTYIKVKTQVAGMHRWPGAGGDRKYLDSPHRHQFIVEALMQVKHDQREVEFHDLQLKVTSLLHAVALPSDLRGLLDFGGLSCEMIAQSIAQALADEYGDDRIISVEVSEDGECSAVVTIT